MFVLRGGDLRPPHLLDLQDGESLADVVVEGPLLEDESGPPRHGDGVEQPECEGVGAVAVPHLAHLAHSHLVNLRKSKIITLIRRLRDIPWMFILVQSDILSRIIPS